MMKQDLELSSLDPLMSESSNSRISSLIWANCFFASFLSALILPFLLELLLVLEQLDRLERVDLSSLWDGSPGSVAVQTLAM